MEDKNLQKEFEDLYLIEQILILQIEGDEGDLIVQTLMEEPYYTGIETLFHKGYFNKGGLPGSFEITKKLTTLRDYINNKA